MDQAAAAVPEISMEYSTAPAGMAATGSSGTPATALAAVEEEVVVAITVPEAMAVLAVTTAAAVAVAATPARLSAAAAPAAAELLLSPICRQGRRQ
jgi:hypothetical protein